jgi:UDPglucose 6-dehydrogenase
MRITVIGTSLAGLVTGACLADLGHDIVCYDRDGERIARLGAGDLPEPEPGLGSLIEINLRRGRLAFSSRIKTALAGADAIFIAVETPMVAAQRHLDLSPVHAAAYEIAAHARGTRLLAIQSTVPVGTAEAVERIVKETQRLAEMSVVSIPLMVRPGSAITDVMRADRLLIGADDPGGRRLAGQIFRPLYLENIPLVYTSRRTAELTTYASTAYLAIRSAFVDEVKALCELTGAEITDLARAIDLDRRLGPGFLTGTATTGEAAFASDLLAMIRSSGALGTSPFRAASPQDGVVQTPPAQSKFPGGH